MVQDFDPSVSAADAPETSPAEEETLFVYETDYEVGQDNVEIAGLDVHNPVFFLSAGLIVLFGAMSLIFPDAATHYLTAAKTWTLQRADWLFAVTPVIVFAFALYLAFSPMGRIRLGGASAEPEFKIHSWVAMLFAAGVGVGFMFYGAAEPLAYYTDWYGTPLNVPPATPAAERLAFSATIFHWGLAPWAIYAIVGLALGFFAHNKGLPLSIRSACYHVFGERVWGWPGHIIDMFAVVSTVFGLATTIGIGATQATSGLAYLFGFEPNRYLQIALIAFMTGLAVLSVLRGMDGGVKLLSNINMGIAFGLLIFVVIAGPTILIFTGLGQNLLAYITDTPALTNWVDRPDIVWFHDWTIFYWAWWISWSPFVGMFIARISKGRTVREYFAVVLLAPFTICVIWFTAFGKTALTLNQSGTGELADGMSSASLVLFQMLEDLPFAEITSVVAIFLLVVFIVTSADSGALVVDTITSGGKTDAPVAQRVFWACMLGLTASALLYGGGTDVLQSLQAGTITAALPFTFILLACCFSLYLGLRDELKAMKNFEAENSEAENSQEA
ncbi:MULTISPECIES: BCCT family transporter [Hyphomonas]|nr:MULTISPECIES: BCCT family transporter [Hyphomonas]MBB40353.1 glycine/betaine ABC transporter [Hyphomonas sp.]|tara:strand:- start:2573 stop:4246 length:1674 start_codon:yes stop_codon:yes gene_type:complete